MLKIAFAPSYKYLLPEGHRFPMMKYELIPEQLRYEGIVTDAHFFEPHPVDVSDLLLTHTVRYWEVLQNIPVPRKLEREIGFPVREELILRGRVIAQGTIECALYALQYGISMNAAGGTHHSFADHGEGFCVFNDFAIAANYLLFRGLVRRVLIIDLDVHQGNGTASIFSQNPRVFTFSMHGAKNYPLRKTISDLDIPLEDGCGDNEYLTLLQEHLPAVIDHFKPCIAFYLAGVDVLATDKLGRLDLSMEACKQRDAFVFEMLRVREIPVAVSMGGGYSLQLTDIVNAHVNTFKVAQEVYF